MAVQQLTLESVIALDGGRVPVAFNQAVARAVRDLEDRPNDDKARKITLELSLAPICDDGGRAWGNRQAAAGCV